MVGLKAAIISVFTSYVTAQYHPSGIAMELEMPIRKHFHPVFFSAVLMQALEALHVGRLDGWGCLRRSFASPRPSLDADPNCHCQQTEKEGQPI